MSELLEPSFKTITTSPLPLPEAVARLHINVLKGLTAPITGAQYASIEACFIAGYSKSIASCPESEYGTLDLARVKRLCKAAFASYSIDVVNAMLVSQQAFQDSLPQGEPYGRLSGGTVVYSLYDAEAGETLVYMAGSQPVSLMSFLAMCNDTLVPFNTND